MHLIPQASDQEKLDWLRLIRTENVGPRSFQSLMEVYGNASRALEAVPQLSQKGGEQIKPFSESLAQKEIEALQKRGAQIILASEEVYPKLLREIKDFPPVLTVQGNVKCLGVNSVAIVGSRNASANGCRIAESMARDLGKSRHLVTSGLARGIDTAAHNGALQTGTVAVVAGGIDIIYPPENKDLFYKITKNGAVITEMAIGSVPKPQHFPRRNRIISGMSIATVVVEAALRSGSLITSRYALEQNREVFGVPGSPLDARCKGPNALIKEGAYMAESAEDIINVLQNLSYTRPSSLFDKASNDIYMAPSYKISEDDIDKARIVIHDKLSVTPTLVDDVISQTGISTKVVMVVLLELELAGKLERHSGGRVSVYNFDNDLFEKAL
ncbi:MAG: DNA-processing protein DprA [Candidatus Paceibacterales bacterium]